MAFHPAFGITCLLLAVCLQYNGAAGGATFQERCEQKRNVTTTTEAGNRTEIFPDTCNADQFLQCTPVSNVCGCQDPANQIFGTKEVQVTERKRSKRSPKKGSTGKAVLAGAAAGVAAYQVNKAVDHFSQSSSQGSGDKKKKTKTMAIKACYSRIGTKCAIDPNRSKHVVQTQSLTHDNGTTTTFTSETTLVYRTEMSDCIQNAECKAKTVRNPADDSNIGECVCRDGYLHDPKTDNCLKVKRSGASKQKTENIFGASLLFLLCYLQTF